MNDFKLIDDNLSGADSGTLTDCPAQISQRLYEPGNSRIKTQKAPDGTSYTARKRQLLKAKKGRLSEKCSRNLALVAL